MRTRFAGSVSAWLTGLLLLCRDASAWGTAAGWDTHWDITKDVLDDVISATMFPDLIRFGAQLRDGSQTESHDMPDDNHTAWWGNGCGPGRATWFTAGAMSDGLEGALSRYNAYDFPGTYLRMGYELHMVQDERVPAHLRFCIHGQWVGWAFVIDDMEFWAHLLHSYATSQTPWTYSFAHSGGTSTFTYWLSDAMDDDDRDEIGGDADDEGAAGALIVDGTATWGMPDTDWGTYGQPPYSTTFFGTFVLSETVPGRNEGWDYYGDISGNSVLIYEQLQKGYDDSWAVMIERSRALPPLIPDDDTHGRPLISEKIFGPNKPVTVSFVAMENRRKTLKVSVRAGTGAVKDTTGKVWDGGAAATYDLAADADTSVLPWKDTLSMPWRGELAAGSLVDGVHRLKFVVTDADGNESVERSRTVKFDQTKPTGSGSATVSP